MGLQWDTIQELLGWDDETMSKLKEETKRALEELDTEEE